MADRWAIVSRQSARRAVRGVPRCGVPNVNFPSLSRHQRGAGLGVLQHVNLIQITPGAGGMYCGNCFRDNALVAELRRQGHDTVMVPLYLPMTLDEAPTVGATPTFFGGIN